jgi:hypothetical protein
MIERKSSVPTVVEANNGVKRKSEDEEIQGYSTHGFLG